MTSTKPTRPIASKVGKILGRALVGAVIGILSSVPSSALGAIRSFTLTAAETTWEIGPGQRVTAWTYNATVPGPELRVAAGDTIRVTLLNQGRTGITSTPTPRPRSPAAAMVSSLSTRPSRLRRHGTATSPSSSANSGE